MKQLSRILALVAALLVLGLGTTSAQAVQFYGVQLSGSKMLATNPTGRVDAVKLLWGSATPTGACSAPAIYAKSDGSIYGCNAGSWTALSATSTTQSFTTISTSGAATLASVSSAGTVAANAVTSVTTVAATTGITAGTTIVATQTVKGTTGVLAGTAKWTSGSGVPGGSCAVGDLYTNTAGSTNTTLYVCTATNTWTAK